MSSGLDEYWDRHIRQNNIPPEFGGPATGVSGKQYEQLELDFGAAGMSDREFDASVKRHERDWYKTREDVTNHIMQAKAIIEVVMETIGSGVNLGNDTHEYALWGASDLLQKAVDLLE